MRHRGSAVCDPRRTQLTLSKRLAMTAGVGALTAGCAFGLPTPEIEVAYSPAQEACRQYAQAFATGTDRESIISGLQEALSTAQAVPDDADARSVAAAIDAVVTATVVGTNESVAAANDEVITVCNAAGAPIRMVD